MTKIRLHVFDLGRMHMDKSLLVERATVATRDNPHKPAEWVEFPISAFYIEHANGSVLFDTGCNPNAMGSKGRWPQSFQATCPYTANEEEQMLNRLRQIGVSPDDVKYIVLSHMHNDHAGCIEFFEKSKIFVHDDEFSAALKLYALHDRSGPYIWDDTDSWIRKGLNWHLVGKEDGDLPLLDGVKILNLGAGHAYGMLGLHLTLPKTGGVILVADAIYCTENFGPPAQLPGVVYDSIGWRRTVNRIRWLAHSTQSQVWFGHDLKQFKTLIPSTQGYYE